MLGESAGEGYMFFNLLFIGELFNCHMLDESFCHLNGSRLSCRFYSIFEGKKTVSKQYVSSVLGLLLCLPMTFLRVSR